MLFITHRLQGYCLNIRQMGSVYINALLRVCKLPYTRLRRSSSIVATSSTVACLSSWIVMIPPPEHTVCQEPPQGKNWYGKVGRPSRPSDVAETTNTDNTLLHVPTLHMKWRPLLYRPPCRQPRQAIAPAQYSNLKCVSRLRTTMYIASSPSVDILFLFGYILYSHSNYTVTHPFF